MKPELDAHDNPTSFMATITRLHRRGAATLAARPRLADPAHTRPLCGFPPRCPGATYGGGAARRADEARLACRGAMPGTRSEFELRAAAARVRAFSGGTAVLERPMAYAVGARRAAARGGLVCRSAHPAPSIVFSPAQCPPR